MIRPSELPSASDDPSPGAAPRIVFVSFYRATQPESGAASVTWNLARHCGPDVTLVQVAHGQPWRGTVDGVDVVQLRGPRSRVGKMTGLRRRVGRIARLCEELRPGAVVLEGASWVVFHWLLFRQLRRRLPGTPLVYHAHNVEWHLRREKSGATVRALTRWAEGCLFRHADLAAVVSEVDRRQVQELYGVRPRIVANGVDARRFAVVTPEEVASVRERFGLGPASVLFMGSHEYPPNRVAIDRLVHEIMPAVRAEVPGASLVLTGDRTPYREPWIRDLGRLDVADLPAVAGACHVGAAPIDSGSGTRLKILEYAAAGLPVVAFPKAAEGLALVDEHEIALVDTSPEFARRVVAFLRDPEAARRCGERARARVAATYDWPRVAWALLDPVHAVQAVTRERIRTMKRSTE